MAPMAEASWRGMGLDICRGALMVGFALRLPLRNEILLRSSDIVVGEEKIRRAPKTM